MNKAILYFSCLLCVLLRSGPQPAARAFGQHSSGSIHATRAEVRALRTALEVLQTRHQLPGITASVVFTDGSQIHASAGYSDVEGRRPMNSSSRMLAGSVGKTLFAAFFMRLVAEGRLNLDQRIAYRLEGKPWFKRLPNVEEITFRMLLTHSSGLPEYVESPEFVDALWRNPDRVWTPEELLSYVLDKPAKFPAGHGWSYADTNYILAGYVAEQMTGESLYNQIRQSLLLPLGLLETEPSVHRKLLHLATGYFMPNGPFHINERTLTEGQLPFSPQFE